MVKRAAENASAIFECRLWAGKPRKVAIKPGEGEGTGRADAELEAMMAGLAGNLARMLWRDQKKPVLYNMSTTPYKRLDSGWHLMLGGHCTIAAGIFENSRLTGGMGVLAGTTDNCAHGSTSGCGCCQ